MDLNLVAVIVGIVEGLTEFLPVSSTGHMIIVGHVLGFEGQLADVFDVFVQLGAILSVVFIYKERFARFFTKDGWDINKGLSVWHVAAGIVPVMLVAFFLYHYIKEYLFSPFTVAIGLFLGGLLLGIIEAMAKAYISMQLANSIVFAVLIVVLLVKPSGLLGKYVPEKV